jgi:group I intron endonuclease
MQGIYCIENTVSGRKYYGSSNNVQKRLKQHNTDLLKNIHHNMQLQRCFNKHGDIFKYYLLEETNFTTAVELLKYEQTFIDRNVNGYNMAPANGGDIISAHPDKDMIIQKMKTTLRQTIAAMTDDERKQRFGRTGNKNSNWRNGGNKIKCPVCNNNIISTKNSTCGTCRDRTKENNPFYGKHHTDSTKLKLREYRSGDNSWIKGIDPSKLPYTKQYKITYPDCTVNTVYGLKAVAEEFNVSVENVHATIQRIKLGKYPQRGKFANHVIEEL